MALMRADELLANSRLGATGASTWLTSVGSTQPHTNHVVAMNYVAQALIALEPERTNEPSEAREPKSRPGRCATGFRLKAVGCEGLPKLACSSTRPGSIGHGLHR